MTRPTLTEQLVASRRRERWLLAVLAGTWSGHLLVSHATLSAQAGAALFCVACAGIFMAWQAINLALDSLRFRRSSSRQPVPPTSVKPTQPGVSPAGAGLGPTELGDWPVSGEACPHGRDIDAPCVRCERFERFLEGR